MSPERIYPDEPAGPFPTPPRSVEDKEGRTIDLEPADMDDVDDITAMYRDFDPADRAQGIPPTGEDRIRDWLDTIVGEGVNLCARHDGEVVGHATLVPDTSTFDTDAVAYELAIFVLQAYQRAGIGRALLETLLGQGKEQGVERVWLTVERWNTAAVSLYRDTGFETCGSESFELEMSLLLADE
ncbi:GNAT family N-acetyltransferase [Haloarchaeobius amylolyticus]|uniref:GNAT family N-acetyltransferase n=1 Tax=Haloarchaeobius amylolyticus TaxID=1198296 RepID=UPI00227219E7|nr:GNAT family N-acetyltransferase [Haloarchaeobius amylolyticus]